MKRVKSSPIVNLVCTLLFGVFTFVYLYCFQSDVLAYAQHVLSDGATVYNGFVGAVIITAVLLLLSLFSSRFLAHHFHFAPALYHFPSILVLASLTDIRIAESPGESVIGHAWIWNAMLLVLFVFVNWLVREMNFIGRIVKLADLLRLMWVNLMLMALQFIFVAFCGNTCESDHMRLRAEVLLKENRYAEAAEVGLEQGFSSNEMTMLRSLAMGKAGNMGESFFETQVCGGVEQMLPSDSTRLLLLPKMKYYQYLGAIPSEGMCAKEYLRLLRKRGKLKNQARDFLYTSCLMDRNLDAFASYLKEDYDSTQVMPKHYREALTLYNHLRTEPVFDYAVPEMEADFADFQALMKKNKDKTLRQNALRDTFGNTYWWYYYKNK